MKANETTVLIGQKCVLVPYRKDHVEKYHEWMKDTELQAQTASEPLSLQEEYEMQQSWHQDSDKLTFIVLANDAAGPPSNTGLGEWLKARPMVGDVNLFLSTVHDDEDENEPSEGKKASPTPAKPSLHLECELMIAEPAFRGNGLGKEALSLMIAYARHQVLSKSSIRSSFSSTVFVVKIGMDNVPSIALFKKLGFESFKTSEVWKEVEMHLPAEKEAELVRNVEEIGTMRGVWPLPAGVP